MIPAALDALLLDAVAAFVAVLANPFVYAFVLVVTILAPTALAVRIGAAAVGSLWGALELLLMAHVPHVVVGLLAAAGAGLLVGELFLHVVLPVWHFAARVLLLTIELLRRLI